MKDIHNEINQLVNQKFGTDVQGLTFKQLHTLNKHQLYTPKQITKKINKSYFGVLSQAQKSMEEYKQNITIDEQKPNDATNQFSMNDKVNLQKAKAKYDKFNGFRETALEPINKDIKNHINLVHKDGFSFTPATAEQINKVPSEVKVAPHKKHTISAKEHLKNHLKYMKVKNNPKLHARHVKRVRAYDRTRKHRLSNKRWRMKNKIKKAMESTGHHFQTRKHKPSKHIPVKSVQAKKLQQKPQGPQHHHSVQLSMF